MMSVQTSKQGKWRNFPVSRTLVTLLIGDNESIADAAASDMETVFESTPQRAALDAQAVERIAGDYDLIFLQCDVQMSDAYAVLEALAALPTTERPAVILQSNLEVLDDLFGVAESLEADILIGSDPAERIVTLAQFARRSGLREEGDETAEELRRLTEQIAEFAQQMQQLRNALGAGGDLSGAEDRLASPTDTFTAPSPDSTIGFQRADSAKGSVPAAEGEAGENGISAAAIRQMIAHRRLRDKFFPGNLFADPAWDILLDLYAARLENVLVSVSSLCIAAAVPPTTALRWVKVMTRMGLLEREPDRYDKRRIYVVLAPKTVEAMTEFLTKIAAEAKDQPSSALPIV